jgi:microcystin-dependent protein
MAYQINFTDSVNKGFLQVDPNTVNTETSLSLPGRTKSDYGALILENLLHLLENFANNNPPESPVEGQLWYDTTVGVDQLKVYDGVQWVSASSIKKANSRPEAVESNLGDLWVDTVNQQLFLYNGNGWTLVGPEFSLGSNTGAKFETFIDTTNAERPVVVNYVDGIPLLIVSNGDFRPKSVIQGFDTIKTGLNIASGLKYYGISESAESLIIPTEGNVLASNFARRDRDNTFVRPIRIQNNSGISLGETPTLQLSVSGGSNSIFRNLAKSGDIQLRLTDESSRSNTILTLKSDKRVGINTEKPNAELDVIGTVLISEDLNVEGTLRVSEDFELTGDLTIDPTKTTSLGNITLRNIIPDQSGRNIGTNNLRFNNIFAQTFNAQNGSFVGGTFTGTFIGTLDGPATRLTSNTDFQLAGDITSNTIVFGGTGNVGGSKVFNTQISPTFILNRPIATVADKDDDILIIRNVNGIDQIQKIKQEILVSTIPLIPVGLISPFGGTVPPPGWLLCDGSVLPTSVPYNRLHTAIGWKFDPTLTNTTSFRLPDLRGRFPLGNQAMNNSIDPNLQASDVTTVNDPEASEVGAKAGSASKTITTSNLPEHTHSLTGDLGTDFYAITNIPNAPDSGVDGNAPNISGTLQSSSITQTGGVNGTTGDDLSVVNPYQTVNYIIYAGAII